MAELNSDNNGRSRDRSGIPTKGAIAIPRISTHGALLFKLA